MLPVTDGLPPAGTWTGIKTDAAAGVIPGDSDIVAAGTGAPDGPAQFTYGAWTPIRVAALLRRRPRGPSPPQPLRTRPSSPVALDRLPRLCWGDCPAGRFHRQRQQFRLHRHARAARPPELRPVHSAVGWVRLPGNARLHRASRRSVRIRDHHLERRHERVAVWPAHPWQRLPTDCADAQDLYGATANGRYVIQPQGGEEFSVYCAGMNDAAKDYLSLTPELAGPGTQLRRPTRREGRRRARPSRRCSRRCASIRRRCESTSATSRSRTHGCPLTHGKPRPTQAGHVDVLRDGYGVQCGHRWLRRTGRCRPEGHSLRHRRHLYRRRHGGDRQLSTSCATPGRASSSIRRSRMSSPTATVDGTARIPRPSIRSIPSPATSACSCAMSALPPRRWPPCCSMQRRRATTRRPASSAA